MITYFKVKTDEKGKYIQAKNKKTYLSKECISNLPTTKSGDINLVVNPDGSKYYKFGFYKIWLGKDKLRSMNLCNELNKKVGKENPKEKPILKKKNFLKTENFNRYKNKRKNLANRASDLIEQQFNEGRANRLVRIGKIANALKDPRFTHAKLDEMLTEQDTRMILRELQRGTHTDTIKERFLEKIIKRRKGETAKDRKPRGGNPYSGGEEGKVKQAVKVNKLGQAVQVPQGVSRGDSSFPATMSSWSDYDPQTGDKNIYFGEGKGKGRGKRKGTLNVEKMGDDDDDQMDIDDILDDIDDIEEGSEDTGVYGDDPTVYSVGSEGTEEEGAGVGDPLSPHTALAQQTQQQLEQQQQQLAAVAESTVLFQREGLKEAERLAKRVEGAEKTSLQAQQTVSEGLTEMDPKLAAADVAGAGAYPSVLGKQLLTAEAQLQAQADPHPAEAGEIPTMTIEEIQKKVKKVKKSKQPPAKELDPFVLQSGLAMNRADIFGQMKDPLMTPQQVEEQRRIMLIAKDYPIVANLQSQPTAFTATGKLTPQQIAIDLTKRNIRLTGSSAEARQQKEKAEKALERRMMKQAGITPSEAGVDPSIQSAFATSAYKATGLLDDPKKEGKPKIVAAKAQGYTETSKGFEPTKVALAKQAKQKVDLVAKVEKSFPQAVLLLQRTAQQLKYERELISLGVKHSGNLPEEFDIKLNQISTQAAKDRQQVQVLDLWNRIQQVKKEQKEHRTKLGKGGNKKDTRLIEYADKRIREMKSQPEYKKWDKKGKKKAKPQEPKEEKEKIRFADDPLHQNIKARKRDKLKVLNSVKIKEIPKLEKQFNNERKRIGEDYKKEGNVETQDLRKRAKENLKLKMRIAERKYTKELNETLLDKYKNMFDDAGGDDEKGKKLQYETSQYKTDKSVENYYKQQPAYLKLVKELDDLKKKALPTIGNKKKQMKQTKKSWDTMTYAEKFLSKYPYYKKEGNMWYEKVGGEWIKRWEEGKSFIDNDKVEGHLVEFKYAGSVVNRRPIYFFSLNKFDKETLEPK